MRYRLILLVATLAVPAAQAGTPAVAPAASPDAAFSPLPAFPNKPGAGPYLIVPVPQMPKDGTAPFSRNLPKSLEELQRKLPNLIIAPNLVPPATLPGATASATNSLLVYRESDRRLFKTQHPLLTPDVPRLTLPVGKDSVPFH